MSAAGTTQDTTVSTGTDKRRSRTHGNRSREYGRCCLHWTRWTAMLPYTALLSPSASVRVSFSLRFSSSLESPAGAECAHWDSVGRDPVHCALIGMRGRAGQRALAHAPLVARLAYSSSQFVSLDLSQCQYLLAHASPRKHHRRSVCGRTRNGSGNAVTSCVAAAPAGVLCTAGAGFHAHAPFRLSSNARWPSTLRMHRDKGYTSFSMSVVLGAAAAAWVSRWK
jgi:hypothetical protein